MWRCCWRREEVEGVEGGKKRVEVGVEMGKARGVAQTRLLLMGWEGRARALCRRRSKVTRADLRQLL